MPEATPAQLAVAVGRGSWPWRLAAVESPSFNSDYSGKMVQAMVRLARPPAISTKTTGILGRRPCQGTASAGQPVGVCIAFARAGNWSTAGALGVFRRPGPRRRLCPVLPRARRVAVRASAACVRISNPACAIPCPVGRAPNRLALLFWRCTAHPSTDHLYRGSLLAFVCTHNAPPLLATWGAPHGPAHLFAPEPVCMFGPAVAPLDTMPYFPIRHSARLGG